MSTKKRRKAGRPMKAISRTDSWLEVENHIVLFGDPDHLDLDEEYFDKASDLESDYTRSLERLAVDFEHGEKVDGPYAPGRDDILGYTDWSTAEKTEAGVLVRSMLDRRNQYMAIIEPMIEAGWIGTSSEASDPVDVAGDGHIRRWPLKRNSLTLTPAEPRMILDQPVQAKAAAAYKKLRKHFPDLPVLDLEAAKNTATAKPGEAAKTSDPNIKILEESMTTKDGDAFVKAEQFLELQGDVKALNDTITQLVEQMANSPAAKKAGKMAPNSEGDHPGVKSFPDFLHAVMVGNHKRLTEVYKASYDSKAFKDQSGNVGTRGGILVPEEYAQQILAVAEFQSGIVERVTTIPTNREAGRVPALDQYFTPTAGSGETAAAANISMATVAAGGTITETDFDLTQLKWRLNKMGGVVDVENELIDDSPFAIEALLTNLFAIAYSAKAERNILRGSGAGEPLGILNWAGVLARVPATDNSFTYVDAHYMVSVLKKVTNNVAWIVHPGILPDIYAMESSAGGPAWLANYKDAPDGTLLGYPILKSEHLPQDDNAGCVILGDLGAYLYWQKQAGLAVAYSDHVNFKTDMGCWRFLHRNDGKPWFKDKITLADPQGSFYMSPFVYLND